MKVLIEVEYRNHTEIELTNEKGDTYRSKSEELQDFFSGLQEFKFDVKPSYLHLKDKETKVFEDWALKQGYYVEKYKWFDIAGDGINYYTIVNRYKRKFKL